MELKAILAECQVPVITSPAAVLQRTVNACTGIVNAADVCGAPAVCSIDHQNSQGPCAPEAPGLPQGAPAKARENPSTEPRLLEAGSPRKGRDLCSQGRLILCWHPKNRRIWTETVAQCAKLLPCLQHHMVAGSSPGCPASHPVPC